MSSAKKDEGIVDIHGKQYKTVARRIVDFRERHADYAVVTKVLSSADMVQVRATIKDATGMTLAVGHAEEVRGSTNINKTSALENAETSAVGRALAFLGMGGTEIASADEVANAITQQKEFDMVEKIKKHNACVRDHFSSIMVIKESLAHDDYAVAYEAYQEIPDDDKHSLTLAPTKGGIFSTDEVKQLRSNEWTAARREYHGLTGEES